MSSLPYGAELNRLAAIWAEQPGSTCFAALAEALRKRGALTDAAAVASAGVASRPEYLPGQVVMARIYGDQGDWDAADMRLRAALLLDSTNPVVLQARDEIARRAASPVRIDDPARAVADVDEGGALPYTSTLGDDTMDDEETGESTAEAVLTESLAMLYRGQGHLAEAVEVLDALVSRSPANAELVARRDALRAELDVLRPRPYSAAHSGGLPVRHWLSAFATAHAPAAPPASSFDEFYQVSIAPTSTDGDLEAFQAWLKELER